MPFQKGNTLGKHNGGGRPPKGQSAAEMLRALGELKHASGDKTRKERALEVIWEQACKGNLQALQWIVDRTEGKVPDKVEQTVNGTVNHAVDSKTVKAVLSAYANRKPLA